MRCSEDSRINTSNWNFFFDQCVFVFLFVCSFQLPKVSHDNHPNIYNSFIHQRRQKIVTETLITERALLNCMQIRCWANINHEVRFDRFPGTSRCYANIPICKPFYNCVFDHRSYDVIPFLYSQIFAVCALYTTVNFESEVTFECRTAKTKTLNIDYPFRFGENVCPKNPPQGSPAGTNSTLFLSADVSSDAQFFVATGALSILYCIFIVAVYTIIDEIYKSKAEIPLAVSKMAIAMQSRIVSLLCFHFHRILCWLQF